VIPGRLSRWSGGVVLLAVLPWLLGLAGCGTVDGVPSPGPRAATPDSPEQLEALVVREAPSGLPRLPDAQLHPPAGVKWVDDVAAYSVDPAREREVLADYGYRYGWERFWGSASGTGPMTVVFVDQFEHRAGAGAYAKDLAENDAEFYRGMLRENPPGLPGGCRMLTVEQADPAAGLDGPAAFAWCGSGVFSVGVTAVADSVDAAEDEVRTVLELQLDRLPPR
jgi:hypothetical protein